MDFSIFNLNAVLNSNISASNYITPTPIQAQAIPAVLEGRDVLGLAQTGTGKTAAFVLPILERLMSNKPNPNRRPHVRALIIAPTRELADQINKVIITLGRKTGIYSTTIFGGMAMRPQLDALRRGVDIVVGCPGRLLDHIEHGDLDLSQLEVLVLDEADHMFDMGFLPNIRRIIRAIPKTRQTLLFSATMPDDIRKLASEIVKNPVTAQIANMQPVGVITQKLYPVNPDKKTDLLVKLLTTTSTKSVVVFTRTKHRAKKLGTTLERAGFKATSLQGNLSQNKRQAALDGFRKGSYQVLVATDIAARGIDVSLISHVINYDIPDTAEAYTHRIGRTGRQERTGDAITFVSPEDESTVRDFERRLRKKFERFTLNDFDYKAAPHTPANMEREPRDYPERGRSSRGNPERGDNRRPTRDNQSRDRRNFSSRGQNRGSQGRSENSRAN